MQTERTISHGGVIRYGDRWLQLKPGQRRYGPTKSKALVCQSEDGAVEVYYRGERIRFEEIAEPVREVRDVRDPAAQMRSGKKAKPDHPWRQGYEKRMVRLGAPPVVLLLPLRTEKQGYAPGGSTTE